MKTLGVVVAYCPDLQELSSNIKTYISELDRLIIWDNTPDGMVDAYKQVICLSLPACAGKIKIMTTGKNEGIGYALNRAAEWGIENRYDYLLTMDQDSHFAEGSMEHYLATIHKADRRDVVMYTSMLRLVSGDDAPFEGVFRENKLGITSGSIIPLTVFAKTGFFREDLFIEGVDLEMCWRAAKQGLKVLQVNQVYLNHSVGNRKEFSFLGKKLHTYNYAPVRLYYSVRNHIWLYRKYKDHAFMQSFFWNNIFKRAIAIVLLETDKRKKLCAMGIGFRHGLSGKLGKSVNSEGLQQ